MGGPRNPLTKKILEEALSNSTTIAEAARYLGANPSSIRKACKREDINTKEVLGSKR
jgi:transposase-like protein